MGALFRAGRSRRAAELSTSKPSTITSEVAELLLFSSLIHIYKHPYFPEMGMIEMRVIFKNSTIWNVQKLCFATVKLDFICLPSGGLCQQQ